MYTGYRLANRRCAAALLLGLWLCPVIASAQERSPWGMHMMWGSWGIGMMLMMMLFWVSTLFCRPVKNGWQLEQTATRRLGTVERVGTVAPQVHVISVSTDAGW